jgi:predicted house-cleaning NTP pyrophosphatase (Maf/HAM1 superfamily)
VFHTGVALVNARTGRAQVRLVDVASTFRALSDEDIDRYLAASGPTIAPGPSSRRASGSRCSSGSKATTRPR